MKDQQLQVKQRQIDPTYQDVPHILIGSFEAAEADAGPEKTLTAPHVTRRHLHLPNTLCFRVVQLESDHFFNIGL